jgi:hypothetical protein
MNNTDAQVFRRARKEQQRLFDKVNNNLSKAFYRYDPNENISHNREQLSKFRNGLSIVDTLK